MERAPRSRSNPKVGQLLAQAEEVGQGVETNPYKGINGIAPKYATKDCGRCKGKGYGYFRGGHNAPGECYGCWGKGKRLVNRKALEREAQKNQLAAARVAWRIIKQAEAIAVLPRDRREVATRLRVVEGHGKVLAAQVAGKPVPYNIT